MQFPHNGETYLFSFGGWQERWKISLPPHGKPVLTTNYVGGISDMDSGAGNELPVGVWKHVVMVHDGAKDKIYIDGVKVAEKAVNGALNNTTKPFGIGYNAVDGGNVLDGLIDEVRFINVALADVEIPLLFAALMQAPSGGDTEAPCAPLNLTAECKFYQCQLAWLPATDNTGIAAYNVYQDGEIIVTTPDLKLLVTGLAPLTAYIFGVSALDAAGNESSITTLKVTPGGDQTPDTTPPPRTWQFGRSAGSNSMLLHLDSFHR